MYRLENVNLKFKNKIILNNFSYSFKEKGLYYIIGPTGCGKTTLLKLMYLNKYKYTGNVYFNNQNIKSVSYKKIELIRNDITYIGVKNQAFNSLTLRQNLRIILGREYDDNKIDELINKYDLTKYLDKKYKNLSMGEKERFLLIIPLIKRTKIVMIDEGFANLDRKYSLMLKEEYENLSNESLVIIVEHILENIEKGEIIDFNKLENNYVTEEYSYVERKFNKHLGFINYLRIFKIKIMINLLLVGALIILSSIFISSLYTTKIDEDELEAMCLRALPTDTIFIDETRINPSDYNITNKILYFQHYEISNYSSYNPLYKIFICEELNMNGKRVKLNDGILYTANDDSLYNYSSRNDFKVNKYNDNSDIFIEESVSTFYNKYSNDDRYPSYHYIMYMNYNTFRMTKFCQIAPIISWSSEARVCISNESMFLRGKVPGSGVTLQSNKYDNNKSFLDYDMLVYGSYYEKNGSNDYHEKIAFDYTNESAKIDLVGLRVAPIGKVYSNLETIHNLCYIYLSDKLFKEMIWNKKLTLGDWLYENRTECCYQLSKDSDIKGLVKENKRRIANGEKEIFKIMTNSNLEYKKETFLMTFNSNKYLENIGLSGIIIFIILLLLNSNSRSNKILLNYNYRKNNLKIYKIGENFLYTILLILFSIFMSGKFFAKFHQTTYLKIESYHIVFISSIIIGVIILITSIIKDCLELKINLRRI